MIRMHNIYPCMGCWAYKKGVGPRAPLILKTSCRILPYLKLDTINICAALSTPSMKRLYTFGAVADANEFL